MKIQPLFNVSFLASKWESEYQTFKESKQDEKLLERLRNWAARSKLKETATEAAFIQIFFCDIWEFTQQGVHADGSYQCLPQFPIARSGQGGGTGQADLALGFFGLPDNELDIPQVVCEFKDIKSLLDGKQHRKGNDRSPVRQCMDYLREAQNSLTGNELVAPLWGIVTDMNEFRLYCRTKGDTQCQRFVISPRSADEKESLLEKSETGAFLRFLFQKMFHHTSLLTEQGDPYLKKLLKDQLIHETALEKDFYLEYRAYREYLYTTILASNPDFKGTRGNLVRLTQRFLDRCLFLFFCEDMGKSLDFPANLLRDILIDHSKNAYYNPDDNIPWERLKNLFAVMDHGGNFGKFAINRFNGGLFGSFSALEQLKIPAKVFCAKNQGAGGMETLLKHPLTLLFFTAKYNFGIKDAGHERMIDLYALGRIFEQSITELEIMEAQAEGRPSINLLTKRKRDGVYYTPEWVTSYIVKETVGAYLESLKNDLGLDPLKRPHEEDIAQYGVFLRDKRKTAKIAGSWLESIKKYRLQLNGIKVVDPACGSGAFLIQALEYLKQEHQWAIEESVRITGQAELWDVDQVINDILANNLYGVDINPESVEIAKLALWMHTASPGKPLSDLDRNIRCGNSLVSSDFYQDQQQDLFDEAQKEQINTFDWKAAFPEVWNTGGFHCVIGNPPYVKLQHFRRIQSEVAEYLTNAVREDGAPLYESAQTGNFDLYLLFIEKGLELLRPNGRMGYIAPSLWMMNEYGRGLRKKLKRTRQLDRWVDFKSFQVFEEAITYTALQFFRGSEVDAIRCAFLPRGDMARIDWNSPDANILWQDIPEEETWVLLPDMERNLIGRLKTECATLFECSKGITVGIQTSADHIYHLTRIGANRYRNKDATEVEMEDDIMHPLVSGPEAKRYQEPVTDTFLLFPYDLGEKRAKLFTQSQLAARFPHAWKYFKAHEKALRKREKGKMDQDNKWWAYNYPKNLDKQELPKLCVAQTVPRLRLSYDHAGSYYFNNVRVNGILPYSTADGWFLLGVMNAPVADFVFRRISKPKEGGYYEANKQFIAPLPIPKATEEEKSKVSEQAKPLQELHTQRRDLVLKCEKRLNSTQTQPDKRRDTWLWANVGTVASWKKSSDVPEGLKGAQLTAWTKDMAAARRQVYYEEWDARLHPGVSITVENSDDELQLKIGDVMVLELFDEPETSFIATQWRLVTRDLNITEKFKAKKLVSKLLALRKTDHSALKERIVSLDDEITNMDKRIMNAEKEMNEMVYGLYGLTDEEIAVVESG